VKTLKRTWNYLIVEPCSWLFYFFFQAARFKKERDQESFTARLWSALRLALPLFLCCFWLSLLIRMLLYSVFPGIYDLYFPANFFMLSPDVLYFWFDTLWVTALCIAFGLAITVIFDSVLGVTASIAVALASGICIKASYDSMVALVFGLLFGLLSGLTFVSTRTVTRRSIVGMVVGIVLGIVNGSVVGTLGGFWGGMIVGIVGGQATSHTILGSVGGGSIGGILAAGITRLMMSIGNKIGRRRLEIGEIGTRVGLILSGAFGVAVGISVGDVGLYAGMRGVSAPPHFADGVRVGMPVSIIVGITFLLSYLIGYYRLPLYPISAFSALRAYFASRKNPYHVFVHLHRSSLYWDERALLPLPYLISHLGIAREHNEEQTLEEIAFIVTERPTQMRAAKVLLLEIAIHYLEMCSSLRDITSVSAHLGRILFPELGLLDPQLLFPFARFYDASLEAGRYYSPLSSDMRRDALETMLKHLERAASVHAAGDARLSDRLARVITSWQQTILHALADTGQLVDTAYTVRNPFIPGRSIEPRDSRFVGRHDLAQQLSEVLQSPHRHSVVLLYGERHMGKSSLLMNLAYLLGASYIPVMYNMQRSTSSSVTVFLGELAGKIWAVTSSRGLHIKKLKYEYLQEASEQHEMAVYRVFDHWLNDVQRELEREGKILLLAFDEYECFELAGRSQHFNLEHVLAYFRNLINNSHDIVLLFSGLAAFTEMQANWAGYFEHVQSFKVSFLQPQEALQLVTRPTPYFPSQQVVSEDIVRQIVDVTACHPFFVQGVCSALVEYLNKVGRFPAEVQDVTIAVSNFLDAWWDDYFQDLWLRTSSEQRRCLDALNRLGVCSDVVIQQETGLDESTLKSALDILLRRDLVTREQENYRIAAPLLRQWVECGKKDTLLDMGSLRLKQRYRLPQ